MLNLFINQKDKSILRKLAFTVSELASRPIEDEKRKLWYKHNQLDATRPLIFCDPENGWNEIITQASLECQGELARNWEFGLKKEIFWGESMGDDRVIEPFFNIGHVYTETGYGMQEIRSGGENGGAYHWESPLKDYKDLDKLHFNKFIIDYEATQNLVIIAKDIFEGILPVRLKTCFWWTLGLTWTLVNLRGLEQIMYDMYDYPDELHQLMAFLRDDQIARIADLENMGLLSLNNDGTYVGSGGFGWTNELPQKDFNPEHVRLKDIWGFAESQETSEVSPEMFEEFIYPYQAPIMERFGLNCYGCCEPLHKRWHVVKKLPNLRRISVSPWSDKAIMTDLLKHDYIYSMKPNPSYLSMPHMDEKLIREQLREDIQTTKNCRVEIIMKDNHTIGKNPQNVINWCKIAREEAER